MKIEKKNYLKKNKIIKKNVKISLILDNLDLHKNLLNL